MDRCQYMGEALYVATHVYASTTATTTRCVGNWARITWRQAEMDAWGRCFEGVPGYLATVDDAAENAFLLGKMLAHQGFASGNAGWIGSGDMTNRGPSSGWTVLKEAASSIEMASPSRLTRRGRLERREFFVEYDGRVLSFILIMSNCAPGAFMRCARRLLDGADEATSGVNTMRPMPSA